MKKVFRRYVGIPFRFRNVNFYGGYGLSYWSKVSGRRRFFLRFL